jgi:hypothetical protein
MKAVKKVSQSKFVNLFGRSADETHGGTFEPAGGAVASVMTENALPRPTRIALFKRTSYIFPVFILAVLVLLQTHVTAQTRRPTPTPTPDIPVVVSRDDELPETPFEEDVNELSESETDDDSIELPRQTLPPPADRTESTESKKQKRMMMYLDLLTKTEQRATLLRQQVFEILEKQNSVTAKLKQTEYLLRPEVITSATALSGSLRPEDLREQRKAALETEKANYEAMLRQIEASRANLEDSLQKAELLVERVRSKFEIAVEAALNEDDEIEQQ